MRWHFVWSTESSLLNSWTKSLNENSSELEVKVAQEFLDKLGGEAEEQPAKAAPAKKSAPKKEDKKVPAKKAAPKKEETADDDPDPEDGSPEAAMKRQNKRNSTYQSEEQLTPEEEERLWQMLDKSMNPEEKKTVERQGGRGLTEKTETTSSHGDVEIMKMIERIWVRRNEILGITSSTVNIQNNIQNNIEQNTTVEVTKVEFQPVSDKFFGNFVIHVEDRQKP